MKIFHLIFLTLFLMSCSTSIKPVTNQIPKDVCTSNRQSYKLYVIDKNSHKKIETIKGKSTERTLTYEEFEKISKHDIRMLIVDKIYLINDVKSLELENECLRKFI